MAKMNAGLPISIPWAMQLRAATSEEPARLSRLLTGAILGCGGWVLARTVSEAGTIRLIFEFKRRVCLDIYSVLIAAGVELTPLGHTSLTELCQCTRSRRQSCGEEIASVELEIETFQEEVLKRREVAGVS